MRQMWNRRQRFSTAAARGKLRPVSRWRNLNDAEATKLGGELLRELAEGHPLRGCAARAVARRTDCDDVAFEIDRARLCVVHLTWAKEADARWPKFEFVECLPEDED
jgi:hypothetical protein